MRPDPASEKLTLQEISDGLDKIEAFIDAPEPMLRPFKVACSVYANSLANWGNLAIPTPAMHECLMFVAAAMDLVRYYHRIRRTGELKDLRKHMALLGPGFFGLAGTFTIQQSNGSVLRDRLNAAGEAPPTPKPPTDDKEKDAVRKTVELMLAMAALNTFERVSLEDPGASDPDNPNPDLIIEHDGHRYGIACKSLSSPHEAGFIENVTKGASQLEGAIKAHKVDRNRGVVLLDVSALLDHKSIIMPTADHLWAMEDTGQILLHKMGEALVKIFGSPDRTYHEILAPIYKGRPLPVAVLLYGHALMICHSSNGAIVPVYQKALIKGFGNDTSSITDFCELLNRAIHCQPSG